LQSSAPFLFWPNISRSLNHIAEIAEMEVLSYCVVRFGRHAPDSLHIFLFVIFHALTEV